MSLPKIQCGNQQTARWDWSKPPFRLAFRRFGLMRRMVLLVLLGGLLAGCRPASSADSAEDTKQWQGSWKLIDATYDGAAQVADMEWIVNGEQYTIRLNQ